MTNVDPVSAETLSRQLAAALVMRRAEDIPDPVLHEAKRLLVDFLGVGLAGCREDTGRIARRFAEHVGGRPEATVLGGQQRVPAVHAAFANAISSHSVELDDVDEEALFHHGPPIVAAAVAMAEAEQATGANLLMAVVGGCEMMTRLSQALNPALRDRGFHTTPVCGVFGAAAACGLILGLDEEKLTNAFGLAGAQASGLMEMYGPSMQKRFNPGPAARNGVTAAWMAARGFTGADTVIEGERGLARAFAGGLDEERLLDGLGEVIPVVVEYKAYSCARPIHNAIDAVLALRHREGLTASQVAEVTVFRHPEWAEYHVISRPRSYHEAQVSLPYSVALALIEGNALPEHYERADRDDPEALALSEKVIVRSDASLLRGVSCRLVVRTVDGRELSETVDYARGSVQRPLSDDELADKCSSLAQRILPKGRVDQLVRSIWHLDEADDLSNLSALLVAGEAEGEDQ